MLARVMQFVSIAFLIVIISAAPAEDAQYAKTTKPAVPYIQPTIPPVTDKYAPPSYPDGRVRISWGVTKPSYVSKNLTPEPSKPEYQDDEGDVEPTMKRFNTFAGMMGRIPCDICTLLFHDCNGHCKTLEKANPSAYTK